MYVFNVSLLLFCVRAPRSVFRPKLITAYGGVSGRNSTGGEAEEGGDADKGDAAETSAAAEPRRSPIGPAMPSAAMLAQAQRAALAYSQLVRSRRSERSINLSIIRYSITYNPY